MREEITGWLEIATHFLDNLSTNYGQDYVTFKIAFYNQFQQGKIFSTRFGADFFHETLARLRTNSPIVAEKGQTLAEYDKNFNDWLKNLWTK